MKKSILAVFFAFLACAAIAKADWTEWKPDSDNGQLSYYHRLNDVVNGNQIRHIIQFKNVPGITVHITKVICNDSPLEGWTDLGPSLQNYTFTYDDDSQGGAWTWKSKED